MHRDVTFYLYRDFCLLIDLMANLLEEQGTRNKRMRKVEAARQAKVRDLEVCVAGYGWTKQSWWISLCWWE